MMFSKAQVMTNPSVLKAELFEISDPRLRSYFIGAWPSKEGLMALLLGMKAFCAWQAFLYGEKWLDRLMLLQRRVTVGVTLAKAKKEHRKKIISRLGRNYGLDWTAIISYERTMKHKWRRLYGNVSPGQCIAGTAKLKDKKMIKLLDRYCDAAGIR